MRPLVISYPELLEKIDWERLTVNYTVRKVLKLVVLAVCWDAPASSFENLTFGKPFTQFFE